MATDSSSAYGDFSGFGGSWNPLAAAGSGSFGPWFGNAFGGSPYNLNMTGMGNPGSGGGMSPWLGTVPSWLGSIFGGGMNSPQLWQSLAGLMQQGNGIQSAGASGAGDQRNNNGLLSSPFADAISSLRLLGNPSSSPSSPSPGPSNGMTWTAVNPQGSFPNFNFTGRGASPAGPLPNFNMTGIGNSPFSPASQPSIALSGGTGQTPQNNRLFSL